MSRFSREGGVIESQGIEWNIIYHQYSVPEKDGRSTLVMELTKKGGTVEVNLLPL